MNSNTRLAGKRALVTGSGTGIGREIVWSRVERATVWTDVVKRGNMLRQVRGLGTLVPEEIRWIPAATDGRVERTGGLAFSRESGRSDRSLGPHDRRAGRHKRRPEA